MEDLVTSKVAGGFILVSVGLWVRSWDYFSHWSLMLFMQWTRALVTKFCGHLPFCNPCQIKCMSSASSAICVLEVSITCFSSPVTHIFWAILLENNILCLLTKMYEYEDRELSNHFSLWLWSSIKGNPHQLKRPGIASSSQLISLCFPHLGYGRWRVIRKLLICSAIA